MAHVYSDIVIGGIIPVYRICIGIAEQEITIRMPYGSFGKGKSIRYFFYTGTGANNFLQFFINHIDAANIFPGRIYRQSFFIKIDHGIADPYIVLGQFAKGSVDP
jgi:hypothetical protein